MRVMVRPSHDVRGNSVPQRHNCLAGQKRPHPPRHLYYDGSFDPLGPVRLCARNPMWRTSLFLGPQSAFQESTIHELRVHDPLAKQNSSLYGKSPPNRVVGKKTVDIYKKPTLNFSLKIHHNVQVCLVLDWLELPAVAGRHSNLEFRLDWTGHHQGMPFLVGRQLLLLFLFSSEYSTAWLQNLCSNGCRIIGSVFPTVGFLFRASLFSVPD
jgi:hypothetical protein